MRGGTSFKRWLQFSLAALFTLTAVVGVGLGLYVNRVQRQREVVALVKRHGGELAYGYQLEHKGSPPGPEWARAALGDDFFADVVVARVRDVNTSEPEFSSIGSLERLVVLDLQDCEVGDPVIRQFGNLTRLTKLNVGGTRLSVAGLPALRRLTSLRRLDLHQTAISDASLSALRGLTELEHLDLAGTPIGDEGLPHIRQLPRLRYLNLAGTRVSDQGLNYLNEIASLTAVGLNGSRVTEQGLQTLRAFATLEKPTPAVARTLVALTASTEPVKWNAQPLSDVFEYLEERHGIQIVLDNRTSVTLSHRGNPLITANVQGPLLSDMLKAVIEPLGLRYSIRYEVLRVTRAPLKPPVRIQEPAEGTTPSPELLAKLQQPSVGFQFLDAPLGAILVSLKSQYGLEFEVDEAAFASRSDEDDFLEQLVTIDVDDISLKSALELLFEGAVADCRIDGDKLILASRK